MMTVVLGWDIGGANIKASLVEVRDGRVTRLEVRREYFPLWKRGREALPGALARIQEELLAGLELSAIGVTMTAELCDIYWCKREGVDHVLDCVEATSRGKPIYVLDCECSLLSPREARREYMKVAAANWAATAWLVSKFFEDCIVVDVGSTTTSIIPIVGGKCAALGKNDLEKLMCGELVYTGALRTNVAAIVDRVPVRGGYARVSSELFALSGDVHLILGNISEEDYTAETADGRGKSRAECMARLARVVCADIEMLSEEEILGIAEYVCERQVEQVADALRQVLSRLRAEGRGEIPIVAVGLGAFLAKRAAERAGVESAVDLGELMGSSASLAAPAVGVALMAAEKIAGPIELGGILGLRR